MSVWTPVWKIQVNSTDLTDVTLANLSITSGRTDIFSQAQAGTCQLELINLDNSVYAWGINTQLSVQVKNSSGTFVPIFGGWISDITIGVQNAGSAAVVTRAQIIATGALAKIQKIITDGVLAKDYEGNQIYDLLDNYLLGTWNNVSASQTWATYNPTTTWLYAASIGLGEIDTPGDYEMVARTSSATNLYDLVAQIATSAFGYIYEDGSGNISYADTTHRQDYLATYGYTTLDANAAAFAGLGTTQRIGDVRNKLILNYGNNYGSSVTKENTTSQTNYGVYAESVQWNISKSADANSVGQRYIDLRSTPYQRFQSITYDLGNPELDDSDRNALIGIIMGLPVQIFNLPPNIANYGTFEGFVEGWSFRASYNGLQITFNASPVAFNQITVQWQQVSGTKVWSAVSATLTWEKAIGAV